MPSPPPPPPLYAIHLELRLELDRVFNPDPIACRRLARVCHEVGRGAGLLAFGVVDTHLHVTLLPPRERVLAFSGQLTNRLQKTFRYGVPFRRPHLKPVEDVWHLQNAVAYDLRQGKHHGLTNDPLGESTSLPELLGLRTPWLDTVAPLRRALPRLLPGDLWDWDVPPHDGPLAEDALPVLAESAYSALAISDTDPGRSPSAVLARTAALAALDPSVETSQAAQALEISPRTARRLRRLPADPLLVRAIRRQAGLRLHLLAPSA